MDDPDRGDGSLAVTARAILAVGGLLLAGACADTTEAPAPSDRELVLRPPEGGDLRPVPIPEFSTMSESVQRRLRESFSTLRRGVESSDPARPEPLASAYGEVGTLLLGTRYYMESEAYFLNAFTLSPDDRRWAYYLGHVYRNIGPLEEAARFFEHADRLQPDDLATRVWLGEVYLAQGRHPAAAALFDDVTTMEPTSAAGWFGAGRAALARGDRTAAVAALEEALARDPAATAAHYPLALAFRAVGDVDRAQIHLDQRGDVMPRPVDPLMSAVEELVESPQIYWSRGRGALAAGQWAAAADLFNRGLALAPGDPFLLLGFGQALFRMGDLRAAEAEIQRLIRITPRHVEAYDTLAELLVASGRPQEAIAGLRVALEYSPGYVQARIRLAGILGRHGEPEQALAEFARALEQAPTDVEATLGYALNLARVDRFREASDVLAGGVRAFPDHWPFALSLARLLAAAPDERVRDGQRALEIVENLFAQGQGLALRETLGMALAELGQFADAVSVQRGLVDAARRARLDDVVLQRLTENLSLYERGQPCRRPFGADEMP